MSDYSEISQLRTRCTILESQIDVLQTKNSGLQRRIDQLEKLSTTRYKEVPNVGKFPVDYSLLDNDGDFQV